MRENLGLACKLVRDLSKMNDYINVKGLSKDDRRLNGNQMKMVG
jgi:hypothetical protein